MQSLMVLDFRGGSDRVMARCKGDHTYSLHIDRGGYDGLNMHKCFN
jgi:hypothetical protein